MSDQSNFFGWYKYGPIRIYPFFAVIRKVFVETYEEFWVSLEKWRYFARDFSIVNPGENKAQN